MALNIKKYKRVFKFENTVLPDPNIKLSPEEVLLYYSNQYPQLTTSNIHGPFVNGDVAEYNFKTTIGTKG